MRTAEGGTHDLAFALFASVDAICAVWTIPFVGGEVFALCHAKTVGSEIVGRQRTSAANVGRVLHSFAYSANALAPPTACHGSWAGLHQPKIAESDRKNSAGVAIRSDVRCATAFVKCLAL
jgi:hypothetical protein